MEEVIYGDCLEKLKEIKDATVQMVLTDLPYGITANKWDCEIPLDKLWTELLRVGKENATFVFTTVQPFTSKLISSNIELWKHEWVWIKNRGSNFANTIREPFKEHETIQVFSRGKWIFNKQFQKRSIAGEERVKYDTKWGSNSENYRTFYHRIAKGIVQKDRGKHCSENYGEFDGKTITLSELRVPSSWQRFNVEVGLHPTQKPVSLFEYLIKTYTNKGDEVLDCCAGSGTTGIAARNLGRGFILIEKNKEYYDGIIKRLSKISYMKTASNFFDFGA